MLMNIDSNNRDYAQRMLILVCCSRRALTVLELIDAMAMEFGDKPAFNLKSRLGSPDSIREVCPGFIEVDTKFEYSMEIDFAKTTVYTAHFSVQEYLESDRIYQDNEVKLFAIDRELAHTQIASTCLLFLADPSFAISKDKYPIIDYARSFWLHHFKEGRETGDLEDQITRLSRTPILYKNWLHKEINFKLPKGTMKEPIFIVNHPLVFASAIGLVSVVRLLLDDAMIMDDFSIFNTIYGIALVTASSNDHEKVGHLLLDKAVTRIDNQYLENALEAAAYSAREEIVQWFLDRGVTPNAIGEYQTALVSVASMGHDKTVQLLLARNADINGRDSEVGSRNPLN